MDIRYTPEVHCVNRTGLKFCKDLARMNGTPQPNRKWPPALRIKPGSLNHKTQPLTIGPVPDSQWEVCVESNSIEIGWELWYNFCVLEIQVVIIFYILVREYRIVFSEHWVLRDNCYHWDTSFNRVWDFSRTSGIVIARFWCFWLLIDTALPSSITSWSSIKSGLDSC